MDVAALPPRDECRSLLIEAGEALLARPQTYMNRSGAAVRCLAERYDLAPDRVLVIYDEVHLPLGRIRLRASGGAGGHRGMESILEAMGSEAVPRMRLGVGPVPAELSAEGLSEFVLAPFPEEERGAADALVARSAAAARLWLESGIDAAMNRANQQELQQAEQNV